ncbi:cyclic nucleotide-binding domain-containing protein [Thiomicrospira sp. ALE5]|uniref:cyclic nucleotide-binding domain-containing protein n=1 Tax=Thiomicrospira sp. ALE5 TaxID=748650 RepID=UPI0008EDDF3C|nr:cyclic nucleotide-binding domain-containing protein [Thiomicrospira sp. ALE5]SFR51972.1 Cyclic nucleotide-binding domain-containing protein [Thiomicrospira sp. ALE5]
MSIDVTNPVDIIAQTTWGKELSKTELDLLIELTHPTDYNQNEVVFHAETKGDTLYILLTGKLEVVKNAGLKGEMVLSTLKPGALAGELSFIDGDAHTLTLRAQKKAQVLKFKRQDFEPLIDTQPRLVFNLMRGILRASHQLQRDMNAQFMEMSRFVTNQYM